jgi:hypothetical protein
LEFLILSTFPRNSPFLVAIYANIRKQKIAPDRDKRSGALSRKKEEKRRKTLSGRRNRLAGV